MSTIRTSRGGPLIRSKTSPLVPMKGRSYRVLMKDQRPGEQHGRWSPVTTSGHVVVCRSRLEACELCWMIGARYYPSPNGMPLGSDDKADFRYLDWLLANHLRIEPYQAGQPLEVTFVEFIKGWFPDASSLPGMRRDTAMAQVVESTLRNRWAGK